jgi:hypothetical protein
LPDFDQPFTVECDALGVGFDVVLHQGAEPITYFSRPIAARHAKLTVYERELIGLVHAMCHWCPYLWGRAVFIKTDHYSLKLLLDQRLSPIPQHQWASKLLGFDFHVEFKLGAANTVADALSHRDTEEMTTMALSCPSFQLFDSLRLKLESMLEVRAMQEEVATGAKGEEWHVQDSLIVKGRIYLPATSLGL